MEQPGEAARAEDVDDAGGADEHAAYEEFRRALDALPGAADFKALVVSYGQRFGYRTVGRWIAGRAPKMPKARPA